MRHAGMLLELIRTYNRPVLGIPKGNPGSKRLGMVVSAGPEIVFGCGISRGTYPKQNVICALDELSGTGIFSCDEGILLNGFENYVLEYSVIGQDCLF